MSSGCSVHGEVRCRRWSLEVGGEVLSLHTDTGTMVDGVCGWDNSGIGVYGGRTDDTRSMTTSVISVSTLVSFVTS